ncbi:Fertility inhibition FinO-like domain protein [Candidatus Thiomargarita nelsonii]|uniref:Fertility inhibition FinO-like domain protein n=1 Tax=Candidatus Thiomargarita nelsonii TaxID=1003181 RepID=A0A176RTJ1_9GAMM|nr:Fertility inhibition FinO-like domain protein [Candidatus Thiomargarita nelsonii]
MTSKPLGENLQEAKTGLELWLASNPIPLKNESLESPPLTKKGPDLRVKAALEFLSVTFPKCFVLREENFCAFEIGITKKLFSRLENKLPEGMVLGDIKGALRFYCNLPKYNMARSKEGNPRINLEGEVVGEVTAEEVKLFLNPRKKQEKFVQDKVPVVVVSKKTKLKKSGAVMPKTLKPEQVPRDILPEVGTPGTAKMKLFWDVVLVADGQEEQVYRVGFLVKNYRKCLNTLVQHETEGRECIVLLQGKLVNGGLIKNGGLSVQVKKAKD